MEVRGAAGWRGRGEPFRKGEFRSMAFPGEGGAEATVESAHVHALSWSCPPLPIWSKTHAPNASASPPLLLSSSWRPPLKDSLDDGKALSFALRLKNRNSGAAQTQIPKNAATSMKPCSPSTLPFGAPYEYRFGDLRLASLALLAKWKNQVKWSAMTRAQEARKRGEEREMTGQEDVKLDR